ncbi:hypothetical protein ABVB25_32320, partial [Streptomyces anthocyanicus]|uniref:hypothetical protein n=1 Tax=Streptomyces anthocyanicus TaxID=68174 RepID=UPI00336AB610
MTAPPKTWAHPPSGPDGTTAAPTRRTPPGRDVLLRAEHLAWLRERGLCGWSATNGAPGGLVGAGRSVVDADG